MGAYFFLGLILAVVLTGVYYGFYDRVHAWIDDAWDGHTKAIWLGVLLFVVVLLCWGVAIPLAIIGGLIFLLRRSLRKR